MYMRLVRIKTKREALSSLVAFYDTKVIPTLERVHGCRYAGLMQSTHHNDEGLSLTLWDVQADAEAYQRSGVFASLLNESKPFLLESSEYQIRLSKDLTLEYVAVPEEPVVSAMSVSAGSSANSQNSQSSGTRWLRTVALRICPGKMDEFKQLYIDVVIPTLREVKGCRYIYLTETPEKPNELISITSWEREQDALRYEQNGLFQEILESQKHLLSDLYQWKREERKDFVGSVTTSEDVTVEHYVVLAGRDFNQRT
jgi:quinol monooxygenase YgiN